MTAYVTGFCSVAVFYTLQRGRPPAIIRNVVLLLSAVYTFSDIPRDVVIVVDYHVVGSSWLDCPLFSACLPVITLTALQTALQTAGLFQSCLCPRLPCFLYGAGSIPDSNYDSCCTGSALGRVPLNRLERLERIFFL